MKIRRGNREYVLTSNELFEAHKEFVINFMKEELDAQYNVPAPYAIEYAEKAYERYTEGNGETEYECIEWAAKEYEKKYGDTDWDDVNAEDYYDSIEEFCYFKFLKYFGTKEHGVERLDIIGSLIDTVEDFLTEKGIASETEAFIKGRDYDYLADQFAMILKEGNLNE